MTYLIAEGFGNLSDGLHTAAGSREILGDQWSGYAAGGFVIEDRADGRKWIKNKGSRAQILLQSGLWSGETTIKLAFRILRGDTLAAILFSFYDGANHMGCISLDSDGALTYRTNTDGDLDAGVASCTTAIPVLTETHVEVAVTFGNGAAGAVSFYIGGVLSNTVPNIDTIAAGATCTSVVFGFARFDSYSIPNGWKLGDFLVHTEASPIGDVGCYYLESDAAGVDADFTPSAGSNFQNVDEIGPDEDVTYNESDGTAGHRDSFQGPAISSLTVLGVLAMARMRKTGAGAALVKVGAVHGGSETQGADRALSEAYLTYTEFIEDCPSTAAAWTTAEVSAAEASYEVQ